MEQLFASLPTKGGDDKALVLKGYLIALQGYPEWAIANTVRAFVRGLVPGASTSFCPRAPELSKAVRGELQHVYDELERDRIAAERRAYEPVNPRRTQAPEREAPPRGKLLATFSTAEEGLKMQRGGKWDAGTVFVYREGKVYAPPMPAAAKPDRQEIPF